jgi:hypothetical protein
MLQTDSVPIGELKQAFYKNPSLEDSTDQCLHTHAIIDSNFGHMHGVGGEEAGFLRKV